MPSVLKKIMEYHIKILNYILFGDVQGRKKLQNYIMRERRRSNAYWIGKERARRIQEKRKKEARMVAKVASKRGKATKIAKG